MLIVKIYPEMCPHKALKPKTFVMIPRLCAKVKMAALQASGFEQHNSILERIVQPLLSALGSMI